MYCSILEIARARHIKSFYYRGRIRNRDETDNKADRPGTTNLQKVYTIKTTGQMQPRKTGALFTNIAKRHLWRLRP